MRITGVTNLAWGAERVSDLCGVGERKARALLEAVHEEPIGVVLGEDVTLSQREVISLLVDAGLEVDAERWKVTEGYRLQPLPDVLTSWGRPVLVVRPRGGCEELEPGTTNPGTMGDDSGRGAWNLGDWERSNQRKVRCREWTLFRWVQELWAAPGRTWKLAGSVARETPLRSWVRIFELGDHVRLGRCIVDLQWMKAEGIETSAGQPGVGVLIQTALDAARTNDPRAYLRHRVRRRQDDDAGSRLSCEDAAEPETERIAPHLQDQRSRSGLHHPDGHCSGDDSTAHRKAVVYIADRVFPEAREAS